MNKEYYIKKWTETNKPFGLELGYPECCVHEFCQDAPEILKTRKPNKTDKRRYKAGCINGEFTGFIPCAEHAKLITMGKIKLESLVVNRNPEFPPFPDFK